jgi:hypothetical protein
LRRNRRRKAAEFLSVQGVTVMLELLDTLEMIASTVAVSEAAEECNKLVAHCDKQIGKLVYLWQRGLDGDELDERARAEHVINNVIELFDQRMDVLSVIRSNEAHVEQTEQLTGQIVASALTRFDLRDMVIVDGSRDNELS